MNKKTKQTISANAQDILNNNPKAQEVNNIVSKLHRGSYFTVVYQKVIKGCKKLTTTTVRLVNYSSTPKGKEAALKNADKPKNANTHSEYLGNNLIYNTNTQNTLLQVFLTNNPHHRPHSIYSKVNGDEITKDEWYEITGKKPSAPDTMFTININDIVMIKTK